MAIENPTFGCGTFLPGVGPENFPEFVGGGVIDGGGGDDIIGGVTSAGEVDPVEDDFPEDDGGPPDQFPTWPDDIIIVSDDPLGAIPGESYLPTTWDDRWRINSVFVRDEQGLYATYDGQPYGPTVTPSTGSLFFPSIPIDWDEGRQPKTITVTIEWENPLPNQENTESVWSSDGITLIDAGGSDPTEPTISTEQIDEQDEFEGGVLTPDLDTGVTVAEDPIFGGTIVLGETEEEEEGGFDTTALGGDFTVKTGVSTTYYETETAGGVTESEDPKFGTVILGETEEEEEEEEEEEKEEEGGFDTTSLGGDFGTLPGTGIATGGGLSLAGETKFKTIVLGDTGDGNGGNTGGGTDKNPFAGQTVVITYDDPTGGSTTLVPATPVTLDFVDIYTENGSNPFYGGTFYGWDQVGGTGITATSDGEITFQNIPIAFDDPPGLPTQVLVTIEGENLYIPVSVQAYDPGGGNGGGNGGGTGGGDGEPTGGEGEPTGGGTLPFTAGLPQKLAKNNKQAIISDAKRTGVLNLNDPKLQSNILKKKPTGIQDSNVAFLVSPPKASLVPNKTGHTDIFEKVINSNLAYVLSNRRNTGDWDSSRAAGVTPQVVYQSLRPDIRSLVNKIRNYDGTPLSISQIYSLIGTRVLDGTISKITPSYLKNLANDSKKRIPVDIIRSSNPTVNEVAAAALIDRNKFTLDPKQTSGRMKNILPNWKTLSSDIDKFFNIVIGGRDRRFYIKDDNTFITGSELKLEDGDYVDVTRGGVTTRIFADSEIDHAFLLPEKTRQKALSLLGGSTSRTLEVSAPGSSSSIEFEYSLSAPRQNFYILSCVLSSIETKPSPTGSFLLKDSTIQYDLMDTSTTTGLRNVDSFIKYKANHRVFILEDEDLIFNYLEKTNKLTVKQTDILFDSPKTNKTIPILTRQIPFYILIYPSNRVDYNIFNDKSKIKSIGSDGEIVRTLSCRTTLVPEFNKGQTNKFVRIMTDGKNAVDVLGNPNTQTRITKVNPSDVVFKTSYKEGDKFVAAESFTPSRKKTGFRLVKEIITELDNNYLLGLNGVGKTVTEFDVFSRLHLNQFNRVFKLENYTAILDSIRNGVVGGVKVIPPIRHANKRITLESTQLVQRKEGAPADTFKAVKATRSGFSIVPPTSNTPASIEPVPFPG